ncbi:hypothetical protein M9458_025052, partial [Cirrhinus mrigala]
VDRPGESEGQSHLGQKVKDVHVFKSCPGEKPPPAQHPKPTKATKTESALISPPKVIKIVKAKGKPHKKKYHEEKK